MTRRVPRPSLAVRSEAARIAAILGSANARGKPVTRIDDLIAWVRKGLDARIVRRFAEQTGFDPADLARIACLPTRVRRRRGGSSRLTPSASDRILRVARVVVRAEDAFGEAGRARRWLVRSNRALGGECPLSRLDTDLGTEQVIAILTRIEHGVLE